MGVIGTMELSMAIPSTTDRAHVAPTPSVRDMDAYVARNIDIISPAEQAALRASRVLVAGCGSVGGSLVESFVRLGGTAVVLADPEVFDDTNLNRQACTLAEIGLPKAEVLAYRAKAIAPYVDARVYTCGLTEENLEEALEGVTCIFDAIDAGASPWVKYRLHELASQRRIPVIAGFDFGGKATLYVFDYRRRQASPFYGRATAKAHREGRLAECVKWLGYRHFPSDFLGIISDRMRTGAPWPQVTYCVMAMGALATRCVLDLEMRRNVRHVVVFDVHDAMRTFPARLKQWISFPMQLMRALAASKRPRQTFVAQVTPESNNPIQDSVGRVLAAMVLAPSPHNCQPWLFEPTEDGAIHFRWSHERSTPVVDPDAHAVAYSVGCAVEAAAQVADVDWESNDGGAFHEPGYVIGTLRIHGMNASKYARGRGLLETRSTDRAKLAPAQVSANLAARISTTAGQYGAHALLQTVDPEAVFRLARDGAHSHFTRADYVAELLQYLRLSTHEAARSPQGFTSAALGLAYWEVWSLRLLKKSPGLLRVAMKMGLPALMTRNAVRALKGHDTYVLVAAGRWDTAGRIDSGRALMRVWLELTAEGLHCQPVDFPISSEVGRAAISEMFGLEASARPIALLRVGVARRRPPRAMRLPPEAFLSKDEQ